jgi:hypothetical protein
MLNPILTGFQELRGLFDAQPLGWQIAMTALIVIVVCLALAVASYIAPDVWRTLREDNAVQAPAESARHAASALGPVGPERVGECGQSRPPASFSHPATKGFARDKSLYVDAARDARHTQLEEMQRRHLDAIMATPNVIGCITPQEPYGSNRKKAS